MRTTGFTSLVEARQELTNHGYTLGFSSPGRPALWAKTNSRGEHRAIAIADGETEYRIVPYPAPASCKPEQLAELQRRDKVIGYEPDADEAMVTAGDEDLSFLQ